MTFTYITTIVLLVFWLLVSPDAALGQLPEYSSSFLHNHDVLSFSDLAATHTEWWNDRSNNPNSVTERFTNLFDNITIREEIRRPGPDVPEPMVFDLIRPLGVRQGELEANVLGFIPLRRTRSKTPQFSLISGADQSTQKRPVMEWAPEIEYGLYDNFAIEFELPWSDGRLEAYKAAAQYTLGTAFNDQFIHGFQGILFVDRTNGAVTPILLSLAALRLDSIYSLQGMIGYSHEFGGDNPINPTQLLVNAALFAEVHKQWTWGIEANYAGELNGAATLLVMPQVHLDLRDNFTIQFGAGTRAAEGNFTGEVVFRIVRQF
ncbi:MAG TPA: hypothetical protein PKA06_06525 [Gemmatales bacterium]|nr:hypothetical protein [Gemmatales bacterium]